MEGGDREDAETSIEKLGDDMVDFQTIAWEIAKRKQTEELLRESQRKLDKMLQTMVDGLVMVNVRETITYANRAAEQILEIHKDDSTGTYYSGREWKQIDEHGEPYPTEQLPLAIALREQREINGLEHGVVGPNGEVKWLSVNAAPLFNEYGQLSGAVTSFRDITPRRRAEQALRRRNRELTLLNHIMAALAEGSRLEVILEMACRELALALEVPQATIALLSEETNQAVVVAEYHADGQPSALNMTIPVAGNPSFELLLGNKAPLIVGDAQSAPRLAPIDDLMNERGAVSMLILPLIVETEVVGSLSLDATKPRHFAAEDISMAWSVADQVSAALAQVRLNEQRQRLEDQFRQAQRMETVGRLTAGVAHDFNNMLTAINGFAELMRYELPQDHPHQEMVGKILDSGRRAADLVRQLLVFSRKQIIEPRVLNLNLVVADMGNMLRHVIGEDIELKTILAPDLWSIKVDPTQIEQAIVNLAINARDAMPDGGYLTIETANVVLGKTYVASHLESQPGEHVLLAVSDTGVGMSEEVRAKIFEPFFTTKGVGKGTGLGLATVYGTVKQSGGSIWVYSEEGQGSTFKIYLPRTLEAGQHVARRSSLTDAPRGNEIILVVEDDDGVRDLARRVLQGQGYTVLEARNGQEALSLSSCYSGPIHLLLTDVVMPGINGKTLAEKLTQARLDLKVLFVSGYTDNAILHHRMLDPGVVFLQKPFSPMALARKVRQLLDAPK